MNHTLIGIGDLLSEGWALFIKDWKKLLEISIRFLIAGLIVLLAAVVGQQASQGVNLFVMSVATVAVFVINLHTSITLTDYILKKVDKSEAEVTVDNARAFQYILPVVWVSLLTGLAVLGGFVLFIFPGIWLSVLFSFTMLVLLDENKRGTQALARSAELVKGRWWKTLWRLLVPAIIVTVMALLILLALSLIMGGIFGFEQIFNVQNSTELTLAEAVQNVLGSVIQIVLIPLSIIYQTKLYLSLKATR